MQKSPIKKKVEKSPKKTQKPKIEVLYEDNDVVAINKPAGLMVHPDSKNSEGVTLCDWIIDRYGDAIKEVGEPMTLADGTILYRPGIVHRLDRETSGVLLIAKNQSAFTFFKKQFQNHTILKKYLAFVYGLVKTDRGVINRPIARSRSDFRRWSAQAGSRGEAREAVTYYRVLGRKEGEGDTYSEIGAHSATLLELEPKTGRTHQIRVHCKSMHHPVVADPLYEPENLKATHLLGFDRLALHARSISFMLADGVQKTVEAPFPKD
ncbi:MAG: RluA family pseudouridine synthase, partial [Candidatus Pacebacteria bacterium]|nr:RluA family pseudouridine synthase [Candidatus Paceibacterota bacterium]